MFNTNVVEAMEIMAEKQAEADMREATFEKQMEAREIDLECKGIWFLTLLILIVGAIALTF